MTKLTFGEYRRLDGTLRTRSIRIQASSPLIDVITGNVIFDYVEVFGKTSWEIDVPANDSPLVLPADTTYTVTMDDETPRAIKLLRYMDVVDYDLLPTYVPPVPEPVPDPGPEYMIVAGALRNLGDGWATLDDTDHTAMNISSVDTGSTGITIHHPAPAGKRIVRIHSLLATPDETLSVAGYVMGASVGKELSVITMGTTNPLTDFISWDEALNAWRSNLGTYTLVWDAATSSLICQHPNDVMVRESYAISAQKGGSAVFLSDILQGLTTTQIPLQWVNSEGILLTVRSSLMRANVTRFGARRINPSTYTNPLGNIWIYGVFEIEDIPV